MEKNVTMVFSMGTENTSFVALVSPLNYLYTDGQSE